MSYGMDGWCKEIPGGDLISREAAIKALKNQMSDWNDDYNVPVRKSIEILGRLPSAQPDTGYSDGFADGYKRGLVDAQPKPRTGKWLDDEGHVQKDDYCATCSACKEWSEYLTTYCPNCGADMRETWR